MGTNSAKQTSQGEMARKESSQTASSPMPEENGVLINGETRGHADHLHFAAGASHWADPGRPFEERLYAFVEIHVQSGMSPAELKRNAQRHFPGVSSNVLEQRYLEVAANCEKNKKTHHAASTKVAQSPSKGKHTRGHNAGSPPSPPHTSSNHPSVTPAASNHPTNHPKVAPQPAPAPYTPPASAPHPSGGRRR